MLYRGSDGEKGKEELGGSFGQILPMLEHWNTLFDKYYYFLQFLLTYLLKKTTESNIC